MGRDHGNGVRISGGRPDDRDGRQQGGVLTGHDDGGHYQIELACARCHTPFQGVTNNACLACHGDELTAADDSHSRGKFTDPRNAELTTKLDALRCVTCHKEHAPDMTRAMGVTVPDDYCHTCHAEVGNDRPSHAGMNFATCGSGGCHNYHDNTALYEDFLVARASDADLLPRPRVPGRSSYGVAQDALRSRKALPSLTADVPPGVHIDVARVAELETTSHAKGGVNCTACHLEAAGGASGGRWVVKPSERACASCHDGEVKGFLGGRHGMRRAVGLPAMSPGLARQPMKDAARDRQLSCSSCHTAHGFSTRRAAVDACLECHDDSHSKAYVDSPHHALWMRELEGQAAVETGASCATCHLPRQEPRENGATSIGVQHNQNANLRPNEKMIRTVCLNCHGLAFSLGALADARLVATNFKGRPLRVGAAIDMAMGRIGRTSN